MTNIQVTVNGMLIHVDYEGALTPDGFPSIEEMYYESHDGTYQDLPEAQASKGVLLAVYRAIEESELVECDV